VVQLHQAQTKRVHKKLITVFVLDHGAQINNCLAACIFVEQKNIFPRPIIT
jgi:hypothetical protein